MDTGISSQHALMSQCGCALCRLSQQAPSGTSPLDDKRSTRADDVVLKAVLGHKQSVSKDMRMGVSRDLCPDPKIPEDDWLFFLLNEKGFQQSILVF